MENGTANLTQNAPEGFQAVCFFGCGYESRIYSTIEEAHIAESEKCDCGELLDIINVRDFLDKE